MNIDLIVAKKVLATVKPGLAAGLGRPVPGWMCVEAAVCFALGLPHGDDPQCVAQSLRSLKIRLNDSRWSSNQARAKGLERLALAQLGSVGVLNETEFAKHCVRLAIQTSVPAALRAVAIWAKSEGREKLLTAADLCEREPTEANAMWAEKIVCVGYDVAYSAVAQAAVAQAVVAHAAAYAAVAHAAAYAAAGAYTCHQAVAQAAAHAAAYAADAVRWTTGDAAHDRSLSAFCEGVVQILIEMKAPGCQWLYLTEGG